MRDLINFLFTIWIPTLVVKIVTIKRPNNNFTKISLLSNKKKALWFIISWINFEIYEILKIIRIYFFFYDRYFANKFILHIQKCMISYLRFGKILINPCFHPQVNPRSFSFKNFRIFNIPRTRWTRPPFRVTFKFKTRTETCSKHLQIRH